MNEKFCVYCMKPIHAGEETCPHCHKTQGHDAPLHHLRPGTELLGRYLIGAALGEGGFGITYIGRDKVLDMRIAVKEFYPNGLSNRNHNYTNEITLTQNNNGIDFEKSMQRFLHEAQMLAKFSNEPGIVGVRDFFKANGTAYIVMEFLDGITLKNYLKINGPMEADRLFTMMEPVFISLDRIHKEGLIHRDISPDNIMLLKNGQLKLLDFGAAREVTGEKSLSVVLKHGYAPEEQYRTKGKQGPWTDVYAMCATLYKCMTGVTPMEALERVIKDELELPSKLGAKILPAQEQLLMLGLSVRIDNRIQSIEALRNGLHAIKQGDRSGNRHIHKDPVDTTVTDPGRGGNAGGPGKHGIPGNSGSPGDTDGNGGGKGSGKGGKKWIIAVAAVLLVAVVIAAVVLGLGATQKPDIWNELPTERTMISDCKTVLKREGTNCSVMGMEIEEEDQSEKYMMYTVECTVTVKEDGVQKEYSVKLRYEYEDDAWLLSDLSKIID